MPVLLSAVKSPGNEVRLHGSATVRAIHASQFHKWLFGTFEKQAPGLNLD